VDELKSWILRAQGGDVEAFGKVVRRFQSLALRYAYAILGNRESAEDAVQEAFLQAYLSLPGLNEPSAFPAWFRAIVSHCTNRLVRGKRISTLPLDEAVDLPSHEPTPAQALEKKEMSQLVLEAVRSLPESERTVTHLFYFDDYSQREIADLLGTPVTTVNNRLYSSRRRLKQRMGDLVLPSHKEQQEAKMALTYETTKRRLLKGDAEVTIRVMAKEDIPAMRRLDDEIDAGLDFANAQRPPGGESGAGGPWSDDQELLEHFSKYSSAGNITLLAENESGKLVGFAELWAAHELEPFGDSLDLECTDYLWEYYNLGIETILFEEAEKVARAAGLSAVDIGTNTSSGDYPTYRRFGMKMFYEYDNVWVRCKPHPAGWKPSYKELTPEECDRSGLLRVSHWSSTDFVDFAYEPGRPGVYEFQVDGHRVVADFWRCWEPGHEAPIGCELFTPPEALKSPTLMSKILRETAFLAGKAGAGEIPLPCPCDVPLDESLVNVVRREFAFAWMRKEL
jgi:RNA polymerase sigma factor (sigma-70 family)